MSPSPEPPESQALRTLLTLKRYEQPPPGYFHGFSARVIARIEAEAAAQPQGWWEAFLLRFDAKPVLAAAYSVALGGLLVVGMGLSQVLGREQADSLHSQASWVATIPSSIIPVTVDPATLEAASGYPASVQASPASSIEPVWEAGAPSFLVGGSGRLAGGAGVKVERAGFRLQD